MQSRGGDELLRSRRHSREVIAAAVVVPYSRCAIAIANVPLLCLLLMMVVIHRTVVLLFLWQELVIDTTNYR